MKSCFTGRHLPAVGQRRLWLVTMSEVMTMALPLEMVVSSTHLIVSLNLHIATCRIVSNDLHAVCGLLHHGSNYSPLNNQGHHRDTSNLTLQLAQRTCSRKD